MGMRILGVRREGYSAGGRAGTAGFRGPCPPGSSPEPLAGESCSPSAGSPAPDSTDLLRLLWDDPDLVPAKTH